MEEEKYFLYKLKLKSHYQIESNWTEESHAILAQHIAYFQDLEHKGILLMAGRTQYKVSDQNLFGVTLFKAVSEEEAISIMNCDPAIKEGIMDSQLYPFSLAVLSKTIKHHN